MPRTTQRLGRGLESLLPGSQVDQSSPAEIAVGEIRPNPYQPRTDFDEEKLRELATSIEEHGVIQPIVVRRRDDESFELVAGERRLRAAKLAGLEVIPAVIGEFTDGQVMELAVVENLQREDLNPIEEAQAYQTLIEQFGLTQEQLAARLGKSRPHISNTLRLLNLPEALQELVVQGQLTAGHARALLSIDQPSEQQKAAQRILSKGLSVRQAEELVRTSQDDTGMQVKRRKTAAHQVDDPEMLLLEDQLRQTLGTPVRIQAVKNKGTITIEFYGQEDLTRIFERIVGLEEPL